MKRRRNLAPVKQNAADGLLLLMISAFGATVILVRLFLEWTGYPQVGDSTFHIAHVLWGGLLLFAAVGVQLVFANHWASWLSALMGGIGTGLFIDEVGKFITQSNDYFFPLAFPIIYAFMVACVWLYFRVRRSDPRDTRTLLYHATEYLKEVLDDDLDLSEDAQLIKELNWVASSAEEQSDRRLAVAMLEFVKVHEEEVQLSDNWFERVVERIVGFLGTTPSQTVLRLILIVGFTLLGLGAGAKLFAIYAVAANSLTDLRSVLSSFVVMNGKSQYVVNHPDVLLAYSFFVLAVGLLAIAAAIMLLMSRERMGLRIGTLGLVIALTIVNLITFYFSQLYTIADALGQLALIGVAQWYRWRFFLRVSGSSTDADPN